MENFILAKIETPFRAVSWNESNQRIVSYSGPHSFLSIYSIPVPNVFNKQKAHHQGRCVSKTENLTNLSWEVLLLWTWSYFCFRSFIGRKAVGREIGSQWPRCPLAHLSCQHLYHLSLSSLLQPLERSTNPSSSKQLTVIVKHHSSVVCLLLFSSQINNSLTQLVKGRFIQNLSKSVQFELV